MLQDKVDNFYALSHLFVVRQNCILSDCIKRTISSVFIIAPKITELGVSRKYTKEKDFSYLLQFI